jgi:hypothetical protein
VAEGAKDMELWTKKLRRKVTAKMVGGWGDWEEERVSVLQAKKSYGNRWWCWLHSSMNILKTTELDI